MKIFLFLLLLSSIHKAQVTDFEIFPEKKEFSIDDNYKEGLILLKAFLIDPTDASSSLSDFLGGTLYTNNDFRVNLFNF
jgi:hypothetical protein